jgi:hypothetical protein
MARETALQRAWVTRSVLTWQAPARPQVHEEVGRYNSVLAKFLAAQTDEWEAVVAQYRGDLQRPFFEHMQCLVTACKDDEERRDKLQAVSGAGRGGARQGSVRGAAGGWEAQPAAGGLHGPGS